MRKHLPSGIAFPIFIVFFFFSGIAGLIYEVLWMRQFGLVMGNTTVSLSAVLTAFMGGLAIGSWTGGRIADRRRDHLRLYGLLETLIGLYALLMPVLIAGLQPILAALYRGSPASLAYLSLPYVRFLSALAIMIVPTIFMGATLPMLIKYFTTRREVVGERVGYIYGINTIGAMLGAFLAGFYLIPGLGMRLTNFSAVAINLAVGLLALLLGGPNEPGELEPGTAPVEPSAPAEEPQPLLRRRDARVALLGIGLSGIAAMIYQVSWTRMFALLLGSSTYAFSLVVMVNIGGLAVGGLLIGRWIDRSPRPMLFFATLQLLTGASAFAVALFAKHYPVYVVRLLAAHQGNYSSILLNEFGLVGFLLFVPTFLMGGMFPAAARVCAGRVKELGATVGTVYAVNTVGAVVGSFSAALILMNYLGIGPTMLLAIGLNLVVAFAACLAETRPPAALRWAVAGLALAGGAGLAAQPPRWERELMTSAPFMIDRIDDVGRATQEERFRVRANALKLAYYRDGVGCTVTVGVGEGLNSGKCLAVNGKVEASDNMSDMPTQILSGQLAPVLYPTAKSALVIGLGGGVTLTSVLKHDSIERVDMVEISPSVVEAVRRHFADLNEGALDDPRVNLILADGRNHVALTNRTYDVIISEPSNPWMAGISNLFTREFFQMCRQRLNPGGLICQWIHTYNMSFEDFMMVVKTFMETMECASLWEATEGDYLMIGSRQPRLQTWDGLKAAVETPKVNQHLGKIGRADVRAFVSSYMADKEELAKTPPYQRASTNVDDTCQLEWSAPRAYYEPARQVSGRQVFLMRYSPARLFEPSSLPPQIRQWLDRIPAARKLTAEGADKRLAGDPGGAAADLEQVLQMNPYDLAARNLAVELYAELMLQSLASGDYAAGRQWAKKGVETHEFLGFSGDREILGVLYRDYQLLSDRFGDAETAQRCHQRIDELGDKSFAEAVSRFQLTPQEKILKKQIRLPRGG